MGEPPDWGSLGPCTDAGQRVYHRAGRRERGVCVPAAQGGRVQVLRQRKLRDCGPRALLLFRERSLVAPREHGGPECVGYLRMRDVVVGAGEAAAVTNVLLCI